MGLGRASFASFIDGIDAAFDATERVTGKPDVAPSPSTGRRFVVTEAIDARGSRAWVVADGATSATPVATPAPSHGRHALVPHVAGAGSSTGAGNVALCNSRALAERIAAALNGDSR